jgi:hypothetical protein
MCNLVCFDPGVVAEHHANRRVIAGRYGTLFTSAFFVQGPVDAASILDAFVIENFEPPSPDISLGDMWEATPSDARTPRLCADG